MVVSFFQIVRDYSLFFTTQMGHGCLEREMAPGTVSEDAWLQPATEWVWVHSIGWLCMFMACSSLFLLQLSAGHSSPVILAPCSKEG